MAKKSRNCGQRMENEHEEGTKCESGGRIEREMRMSKDKWTQSEGKIEREDQWTCENVDIEKGVFDRHPWHDG